MGFWEAAVAIVAISCITGVLITRTKAGASAPEDWDEFEDELRRHAARIAALEAIVTEERSDLRRQIDQLERS